MSLSTQPKTRAPELTGRAWINTGGQPLSLARLRGKIVLLDFWTFCCVNCLHVLDELRELEAEYADVLVVIGVHSPKFLHEADHDALVAACERYEVRHPVLDDPQLANWKQYVVRAWPTLVVIDPEGFAVAQMSGEGHAHGLRRLLDQIIATHEARGNLRRGGGRYLPPRPEATDLRFPGKAITLPGGTLLVADTSHHVLAELAADATAVLRRIGTGMRGLADGGPHEAAFSEPQGLCALPAGVAEAVGYDVIVADTVNHVLRGVHLGTGRVTTVAGTGRQWQRGSTTAGPAREVELSSPWDVAWYDGCVVVAMAGIHQLWSFDPLAGTVAVLAGTTNEGLVDGPAEQAWFAQTSGLAVSADGGVLWLADAETSALRTLANRTVTTVAGTGLFDFGHRDGPAAQALLQHPLGLTVLPDGSVAVADTYNGAVRLYEPATDTVRTLATGLREPSDVLATGGELLVVESAAHRLARLPLPNAMPPQPANRGPGTAHRTHRPPTAVRPGPVQVTVVFTPPPGQKLDDRYGPATRLVVSASPPELLADGAGSGTDLSRTLTIAAGQQSGVLHLAAMAASCDDADARVPGSFPACHIHQQDWGIPVTVGSNGLPRLALVLRSAD